MYLILTEDKNRPDLERICGEYFRGFTIIPGTGVWSSLNGQGETTLGREDSVTILVHSVEYDKEVKPCAYAIKQFNQQERVDIINLKSKVHWI